jgi:hypothetical protein
MYNLNLRKGDTMEIIKGVQDFPDLPTRMGKRPITIRGPRIEAHCRLELR